VAASSAASPIKTVRLLAEPWLLVSVRLQPFYLGKSGGRNWVRTSDPSLVRRDRTVAGRRLVSPEEPAIWTDRR
jgi:hypothetical protein